MEGIKKRLQALRDMRKDTEPAAIIIGTVSGYIAIAIAQGEKFKEFTTEREAREALTAAGIKKIVTLTH